MRTIPLLVARAPAASLAGLPDQGGADDQPQDMFDTPPGAGERVPDDAGPGSGCDIDIASGGFGADGIFDRRLGGIGERRACVGGSCGPVPGQSGLAVE